MCNTFLSEAQPGLVVFEEIFSVTENTYDRLGCCLTVFYYHNQHFMVHFCKLVIDVADHLAVEGSVLVQAYTTGFLNAWNNLLKTDSAGLVDLKGMIGFPCCLTVFSFG